MTAQQLRQFSETYFGEHGGYAQQYLFHHARMASRNSTGLRKARPQKKLVIARTRSLTQGRTRRVCSSAPRGSSCQRLWPEIMFPP
jgi:hypothetical protein